MVGIHKSPGGGMVDTGDLKSPGHCDRAGSSPAPGTTFDGTIAKLVRLQPAKLPFAGSSPASSSKNSVLSLFG